MVEKLLALLWQSCAMTNNLLLEDQLSKITAINYDGDEVLKQVGVINTKTNEEQGWKGDECWDIQIHYFNLYITEKQNITACIQCGSNILEYETFKNKISSDLYEHYKNYKFYSEPKLFTPLKI